MDQKHILMSQFPARKTYVTELANDVMRKGPMICTASPGDKDTDPRNQFSVEFGLDMSKGDYAPGHLMRELIVKGFEKGSKAAGKIQVVYSDGSTEFLYVPKLAPFEMWTPPFSALYAGIVADGTTTTGIFPEF